MRDDAIFHLAHDSNLSARQIGAAFHLSVGHVARIIARLEERGYVATVCAGPSATFLLIHAPLTEDEAQALLKDYASDPNLTPPERAVALDWLEAKRPLTPFPPLPQSH